jgi:hypothetical protein
MQLYLINTRYIATFILTIFLMTACFSSDLALAGAGAPVIYNYQDPKTGTIVNYIGIPGGPVVYSNLGPGGIKSVSSVSTGSPVVYSELGSGEISSITYVGPGGPVVYSNLGPGGVNSFTFNNPGRPVMVLNAGSRTASDLARI